VIRSSIENAEIVPEMTLLNIYEDMINALSYLSAEYVERIHHGFVFAD